MKVWLSRSRPGADRQAAELRQAGHDVVVAPVIEVEAVEAAPPPGGFDYVVFLSEHAVRLGLPALRTRDWFAGAAVVAVGARTAGMLEDEGMTPEVPEDATSEGLLALPALRQPRGIRILLVAGRGGRPLLGEDLTSRGAHVQRYECYQRLPVQYVDASVRACEAVIAASGEGLRQMAKLWLNAGGRADVPVLVPSSRVAGLGVEVGLRNLHDCGGAGSRAWLRGLARLQSAENR